MRRTSKNEPRRSNSAPKKQTGMFQIFDLKEARAEEMEAEAKARELEREEAERQAEALKEKLAQMEVSYRTKLQENTPVKTQPEKKRTPETGRETLPAKKKQRKTSAATTPRRRQTVVPVPERDLESASRNAAYLNKTLDSSRNFTSIHDVAQKMQMSSSSRQAAPKAELKNMDAFWAELEAARKREAEEQRQREIERARKAELERARAQEAALAQMREEEAKKRRLEEEERQQQLELKRQNEEAAAKWRAEEAARVQAEAEKMREIQIQKAREEEAERIQQREVAKIREAQISRLQVEEEENIRKEIARFQKQDQQQVIIENMLEQQAADYQMEGALIRDAELQEQQKQEELKKQVYWSDGVPEKEPDSLDDFVFPDLPPLEEEVQEVPESQIVAEAVAETEVEESEAELEVDESSYQNTEFEEDKEDFNDDNGDYDDEDDYDEDGDYDDEDDYDEDGDFDDEDDYDDDGDFDDEDDYDEDGDFDDEDDYEDLDDEDDFNEEIVFARQASEKKPENKKAGGKSFVLPSFGKILQSEKPRESRRERIADSEVEPVHKLAGEQIQEEIKVEDAQEVIKEEDIQEEIDSEEAQVEKETEGTQEETEAEKIPVAKKEESVKPGVQIPFIGRKTPNRKKYDAILGKIIAASLVLVMILNAIIPDQETSEIENRSLEQMPRLNAASVADGTFAEKVEEWQSDQFAGRNILRNVQIFLRWIGGDRKENDVYAGKEGQLLEKIATPNQEELQNTVAALNAFAEQYPDKQYSMMLVPDAGTILQECYPAFAEKRDQRGDFGSVKNLLSEKFQWVDLVGALETNANQKLYYKTDHHWTSLGAYYGYAKYCEANGLETGNYTSNTISDSFNGSLARTSGFYQGEKETIEMYVPEVQTSTLVTYTENQRQTTTLYDKEKLSTADQYAVFLGGNNPLVDIKTTTNNTKKLLIFKDSFANCMIPFMVTQFSEIVVVDPRYYTGEIQDLMLAYGITDVVFLYSGNTFFTDTNLQNLLQQE